MTIHIPQNFYKETIAQDWPTGTGNFYVSAKPTKTSGWLVISPSSSTLREIVAYTAVGTDGTGDYVTVSERGVGGTTEQTHVIGETIRMNITAENIQEISDALDQIVAAGAQDASTTTKGIAKLNIAPASATEPIALGSNAINIETTTGTTHSLTTVAGERVIVLASGVVNCSNYANTTTSLKYNGVTKHSIVHDYANGGGQTPVSLMYTEIPGAGTYDITVTATSGGSPGLENFVIIVIKIRL